VSDSARLGAALSWRQPSPGVVKPYAVDRPRGTLLSRSAGKLTEVAR
jgi:hypothetical protein